MIRKYQDRLTDPFKADDVYDIVGFTPTAEEDQELWRRKDQTYVRVYIHLFFNEAVHDHEIKLLHHDVAKVLERKGKTVDPELLRRTSRFLVKREKETEGGKKQVFWGKDESAMRSATEYRRILRHSNQPGHVADAILRDLQRPSSHRKFVP